MSDAPSFPPSGQFIKSVRESSKALRLASNVKVGPTPHRLDQMLTRYQITEESILRLLNSASFTSSLSHLSDANHGLALPLAFPSSLDELNLISVLSLLNFASGYRIPLRTATGKGAWDNIRMLVFGLYISGDDYLSAKGMQSIDDGKIAELWNVSLHIEKPHPTMPAVMVGERGGPMNELVGLVTHTLNQTGAILSSMGYPNLGAFVAEALRKAEKAKGSSDPDAESDIILEQVRHLLKLQNIGAYATSSLFAQSPHFGICTPSTANPFIASRKPCSSSTSFTQDLGPRHLLHFPFREQTRFLYSQITSSRLCSSI